MKEIVDSFYFDDSGRFVIRDFSAKRPFSSFLPGIAGPLGIPMWVFYVNRGQAIASFGIGNKNNPIMEFEPANKAYQTTPYTGFRTFLKLIRGEKTTFYEPFSPWNSDDPSYMAIGMNELALRTASVAHGLQTDVLYFTLPGEDFPGLVRQVTVTNTGDKPLALKMLDGMPRVMPYGVDNWGLKQISRTIEAFMEVFNLDRSIPFYHLRASAGDTAEVRSFEAGHFYLAFTVESNQSRLLPAFVDPTVVFGNDTSLSMPNGFIKQDLIELQEQVTTGRTPCGFFGLDAILEPSESTTIYEIIGHMSDIEHLYQRQDHIAKADYLHQKRDEAQNLVRRLTDVVDTQTSLPVFDAYCRQAFLDNVMRGGWPLVLGSKEKPFVYHVYSRKHGDLERDYNDFHVAAEMYSQGNGNYRDVNQNRRCDVLLNPEVKDSNIFAFLGLIQADGYNPLVVNGSRFTVSPGYRSSILALAEQSDELNSTLDQPFTPGQLLKTIADRQISLDVAPEDFIAAVLTHAEQHFEATFGEGYWIDHWFYNLDLIDSYLAVYPDKKDELLSGKPIVPFFDSPAVVQPRSQKYVLAGDSIRQYGAVRKDEEKAELIASRTEMPNLMRTSHGRGEVYRTTVFGKLLCLVITKFATLDALGMGIEMEAGKPGWYDALNGLPGLLGSSLSETFELKRLLEFLLAAIMEKGDHAVDLPVEQMEFLQHIMQNLRIWEASSDPDRDYKYWNAVAAARETYRQSIRLGFDGQTTELVCSELAPILSAFYSKVQHGIQRAIDLNNGIPPTYFAYNVTDYDLITDEDGNPQCDEYGRSYVRAKSFEPIVLPLFLEGPVHALKVQPDSAVARRLYAQVKESGLFDGKLRMYKVNASLANQSHEIGRARAFPPGWLENESIWLHMEYKYILEVLRSGLYEEFFEDFRNILVPFQNPEIYGRSPIENSSFIASSAHPDESIHGAGFVARLSGSTAEFLSIWSVMMFGERPFFMKSKQLHLTFKHILPGWLFTEDGKIRFMFLGKCIVTYYNPKRLDTFRDGLLPRKIVLHTEDKNTVEASGHVIGPPYATMVRDGQILAIDIFFGAIGC